MMSKRAGCFKLHAINVIVLGLLLAAATRLHAETYFVGHLNPDTDAIVAAIAAAEYYHGTPARTGELNRETQFLLKKTHYEAPVRIQECRKQDVAVVDFNQRTQAPASFHDCNLVEVIDHHALGDAPLTADHPISITIRPWGSSTTIIADMFIQNKRPINARFATLLLGAILSDTVAFRSPTTTAKDHEVAAHLQKTAGIDDVNAFAMELFNAKSDVQDLSAAQILTADFKIFTISGRNVGFGVAETVQPAAILARKDEMITAMAAHKQREHLDLLYFCVVDTLNSNSTMLLPGTDEKVLAEKAFKASASAGAMFLPGLISRKNQFIPLLAKAFEK